ncbi:MAG: tRNA lysidine(34) synthetase TilS [Acidobacteriota bacterium]|nr:MAG: tRNA lysidine(34) synthetase TilS [Acidobacteriota bacterium]
MSPTHLQRKFTLNLLTEWRKLGLPLGPEPVLLAVSGGADSCALALAVSELSQRGKLDCRIVIGHFDHGIRGSKSAKDARFVESLAKRLGFRFVTAKAKASVFRSRSNLEEKARIARYGFLQSAAKEIRTRAVLTAHTRNDQAETLLLNLIRGSGLSGLAGMGSVREMDAAGTKTGSDSPSGVSSETEIRLYRPLLSWASREDTERFVSDCGVEPRTDAMNEDPAFQRVRIRKQILPVLSELNPKIIEALARTADTLRLELDLLSGDPEDLAESKTISSMRSMPVARLRELPRAFAVHSVRSWILTRKGDLRGIDRERVDAIVDLACSSKSGRIVELPGSVSVVKRRGRLCFEDVKVEK